eukprot:566712-Alexandrium_andersonii.AAC.1
MQYGAWWLQEADSRPLVAGLQMRSSVNCSRRRKKWLANGRRCALSHYLQGRRRAAKLAARE